MTLYHLHSDDLRDSGGESRSATARLRGGARAAIVVIHRAIVAAKLWHPLSEPRFYPAEDSEHSPREDMLSYPQRPLILGDKWDF